MSEIIQNKQVVNYCIIMANNVKTKKAFVDFEEIKKQVLLNMFFSKMMCLEVKTTDVVNYVSGLLYSHCYCLEEFYFKSKIMIPTFESLRLLSQLYAQKLVKTINNDKETIFVLTDDGERKCGELVETLWVE